MSTYDRPDPVSMTVSVHPVSPEDVRIERATEGSRPYLTFNTPGTYPAVSVFLSDDVLASLAAKAADAVANGVEVAQ